jgi:RimJ/RimL family protein N-acetyltransferase
MNKIKFRKAILSDIDQYFKWLNEPSVREKSFNSDIVIWEDHVNWFQEKINDPNYMFYIFYNNLNQNLGQVRINKINNVDSVIGVSISEEHRGYGYGSLFLIDACNDYFTLNPNSIINAYIKCDNSKSKKIFENAGFNFQNKIVYNNLTTDHFTLYANRKL